eukprot:GHVP01067449.1.p1 GENE.GHVP01067449.1~~GHVP01067449.1.p1  ORF type:complete len:206 (+),score=30.12 GHVP01067449.1:31-618(+)
MNSKSEVKAGLAGAALMTVNGLLSNFSISDFEPGNEPQHEKPEGIKSVSSPTGVIRVQGKEDKSTQTADTQSETVASEDYYCLSEDTVHLSMNFSRDVKHEGLHEILKNHYFCEGLRKATWYQLRTSKKYPREIYLAKKTGSNLETIFWKASIPGQGDAIMSSTYDLSNLREQTKDEKFPSDDDTRKYIFSLLFK